MKKIITAITLCLFVYAWYLLFYTKVNPEVVPVTPTQNYLSMYVEPDSGKSFMLDELNNAQKEILVEVYLLSDTDVINSLIAKDQSGVEVKVMMEEHPFGGGGLNPKTKKQLEDGGVEVEWSNPSFALTHEKSIVIDDKLAFILTQNLTTSSFKNREYDVLDNNQKDVDEIRTIFMDDWNRSQFAPSINNIIESPNTARPALTSLINSSNTEIDIEAEVISDSAITNLLIDKAKTSKIKIIIPPIKTLAGNAKSAQKLLDAKVEVKSISTPYIHAKMILVDNKIAYIGSINFTSQSLDENRELGIIFSENNLIEKLINTFALDWQKAQPVSFTK